MDCDNFRSQRQLLDSMLLVSICPFECSADGWYPVNWLNENHLKVQYSTMPECGRWRRKYDCSFAFLLIGRERTSNPLIFIERTTLCIVILEALDYRCKIVREMNAVDGSHYFAVLLAIREIKMQTSSYQIVDHGDYDGTYHSRHPGEGETQASNDSRVQLRRHQRQHNEGCGYTELSNAV